MILTAQQRLQIAGEAAVDPRTVARIYNGARSLELVRERVLAAARKLNMPLPPSQKGHPRG